MLQNPVKSSSSPLGFSWKSSPSEGVKACRRTAATPLNSSLFKEGTKVLFSPLRSAQGGDQEGVSGDDFSCSVVLRRTMRGSSENAWAFSTGCGVESLELQPVAKIEFRAT